MAYRAIEKNIDLDVVYNHIASGIARLRSDDTELRSIFSGKSSDEQGKISAWFSSDECDIQLNYGFVSDLERLPAVHVVLQSDQGNEKYLGNMEPSDDSDDGPTLTWKFGKSIWIGIAYDRGAFAYYLYLIVKHIILCAEESLTSVYQMKDITYSGGSMLPKLRTQSGAFIHEYALTISYSEWEQIEEVETYDLITDINIVIGGSVIELEENLVDYSI